MIKKIKIGFITFLISLFYFNANAQLTVTTGQTAQSLVQTLIGAGITVTNITVSNLTTGTNSNAGLFTNTNLSILGLQNGIILTSGYANLAVGPNNSAGASGSNTYGSTDPQLAAVAASSIHDAIVLEFDFVPLASPISFRYVFGSEEYPEFVNSYNDAFGFFVSGQNPAGGNYTNQNIAIIPNTTSPVTINNVNNGTSANGPCVNCQYYINNNNNPTSYIQYDGLTTVLTATCNVIPCQSYHIKIAIGDAGDGVLDSGVFLEAGSFSSAAASVTTNFTNPAIPAAIEGCTQAIVSFVLPNVAQVNDTIFYTIGGTATNGADYTTINNYVIVQAGTDSVALTINSINDGITEGTETIILIAQTSVCEIDTILINIYDPPVITPIFTIQPSFLCPGDTALITFTGVSNPGDIFTWNFPGGTIISGSGQGPYRIMWNTFGSFPLSLQIQGMCATVSNTVNVSYSPNPVISASSNSPICSDATLNLFASGGATYLWTGPAGYTSTVQNPSIINPPTTYSGVYNVVTTNTTGCTDNASFSVLINPLPNPTATSNSPICEGTTLILSGGGGTNYLWSGPNGFSSTLQSPIIPNIIPAASGTYHVTVTSGNSCVSDTSTVVIVNPLPTPVASSNAPICSGDSLHLTTSSGVTGISYSWSGPNGYTSTNQSPSLGNMITALAGIYTVTVTDSIGCYAISPVNVVVNVITPSIGNNSPVCENSMLNVYAAGGVSYIWNGPGGYVSTQANIIINQPTMAYSGLYSVTITDANGCLAQLYTPVIVHPLPLPVATNNTPICDGEDLKIFCAGFPVYSWSGPATFASTNQNPILPASTVLQGGIYTVTVTDNHGCVSSTSTNAIVNPLPVITISNNTPVCSGDIVTISSLGGTSYAWSCAQNSFTSVIQNPYINGATVADSGYYTVTVTLSGCTSTATTHVIVNPLPQPTATNNSQLCYGYPLKLIATGGVSYLWHSSNGFTSTSPQPIINNATDAASGVYSVTVTDVNGCTQSTSTNVIVSSKVTVITMDRTICSGTSTTISAYALGGTPPYTYYWDGYLSQSQVVVTPTTSMSYNVQVKDTNGCVSNISTLHVNVIPPIKFNAVSSKDTVCPGESVEIQLNGTEGNGGPYSYYLSDGTIISNPYIGYPDGIHEYIIFAKDGCGSIDSDTIKVLLYEAPPMSYAPEKTFGCVPFDVNFNETSAIIGQEYEWDFGDYSTNSISFLQSPTHLYETVGTYDVNLSITSTKGCKTVYTFTDLITVYPLPGAKFTSNKGGGSIINGTIAFINKTAVPNCKSYWNFGDRDSSDARNPVHIYDSIGFFNVRLVSVSLEGCRDTAYGQIIILDEFTFYAPTAFTPDNDLTNDIFFVYGNGIDTNYFKMTIFDRWGEKIYETDKYDPLHPEKYGWDGKAFGKVMSENGVYSWKVIYRDIQQIEHVESGIVTLIR